MYPYVVLALPYIVPLNHFTLIMLLKKKSYLKCIVFALYVFG